MLYIHPWAGALNFPGVLGTSWAKKLKTWQVYHGGQDLVPVASLLNAYIQKEFGGRGNTETKWYKDILMFAVKKKQQMQYRNRIILSRLDNLEMTSWNFTMFLKMLGFRKPAKESCSVEVILIQSI